MDKPKDYYQILGVPRDASVTAIERAFRRLARQRPVRGRAGTGAGHSLAELQAAYETLRDAERRRRYDDALRASRTPLESLGARPRPASDLRRPVTPTTLAAEVVVSAADAGRGTVLSLDVPVAAACDACGGTGGELLDCGRCGGEGQVSRRLPVPVHVPARTRDGAVFQIRTDDGAVTSVLLTVHVRHGV